MLTFNMVNQISISHCKVVAKATQQLHFTLISDSKSRTENDIYKTYLLGLCFEANLIQIRRKLCALMQKICRICFFVEQLGTLTFGANTLHSGLYAGSIFSSDPNNMGIRVYSANTHNRVSSFYPIE